MRVLKGEINIATVLVMLMLAGYIFTGVKLVPILYDNFMVRKVLNQVGDMPGAIHKDLETLKTEVEAGFRRADVTHVWTENLQLERHKGFKILELSYERRFNFFGMVDVVIRFRDTSEIRA